MPDCARGSGDIAFSLMWWSVGIATAIWILGGAIKYVVAGLVFGVIFVGAMAAIFQTYAFIAYHFLEWQENRSDARA